MLTLTISDSEFPASAYNILKTKGKGKSIFEYCIMSFLSLNDSAYTMHGQT